MRAPSEPLGPGTLLGGRYALGEHAEPLADGTLFQAEDRQRGRPCAVLVRSLAREPGATRAPRFSHPAILELLDEGTHAEPPVHFAVYPPLAPALGADGTRPPLSPEAALPLLQQVAEALRAAHSAGDCHGALCPSAVRVKPASPRSHAAARVLFPPHGAPEGSLYALSWLAPEVLAKARPSAASDVWSFALLAFWLLTGRHYFEASADHAPQDALLRVLSAPLAPPSARARAQGSNAALPEGFDAWFLDCVARDPAARTPSLSRVQQGLEVLLRPPGAEPLKIGPWDAPPEEKYPLCSNPIGPAYDSGLQPGRSEPPPFRRDLLVSLSLGAAVFLFLLLRMLAQR